MITFHCTGCGQTLRLKDEFAGKKIKCPACQAVAVAPTTTEPAPTAIQPDRPAPPPTPQEREAVMERPRRLSRSEDDARPRERDRVSAATSGKAVASLILGLGTCCIPILPAIPGLILGFLALGDINRQPRELKGRGLALTGIIFSIVGNISVVVIALLVALVVPAYQSVGQAKLRVQSQNNLKQLGLAMHNHHDAFGHLPTAAKLSPTGEPLYSWRVNMLPFVEEDMLFRQFNQDARWDAPPNIQFINRMPKVYQSPFNPSPDPSSLTHMQLSTGPHGMFPDNKQPTRFANITDGLSNTIMIVEATTGAVKWSPPADLVVDNNRPLPPGLQGKNFNVVMGDGSVRFIDRSRVNDDMLRLLLNPRDGRPVNFD